MSELLQQSMKIQTPLRILLAEDNSGDVILLKKQFEKGELPFDLRTVKDGGYIANGLYEGDGPNIWPDLIILDINMPRVSGLEALRNLKDSTSTRHIPILMLSSSKAHADIEKAQRLGAQGYVIKGHSISIDSLISFVDMVRNAPDSWIYVRHDA